MEVPLGLVKHFPARQLEDGGVHETVFVLGRAVGETTPELLLIEAEQDVVIVDEVNCDGRLVFREAIHARRHTIADRVEIELGSRRGRRSRGWLRLLRGDQRSWDDNDPKQDSAKKTSQRLRKFQGHVCDLIKQREPYGWCGWGVLRSAS